MRRAEWQRLTLVGTSRPLPPLSAQVVHSANPLPHNIRSIEQPTQQVSLISSCTWVWRFSDPGRKIIQLRTCPRLQAEPVRAPAVPAAVMLPQPADDELSGCGEHDGPQGAAAGTALLENNSSELATSLAVVPEVALTPADLQAGFASKDALATKPWAKEFDVSRLGGFLYCCPMVCVPPEVFWVRPQR